LLLQGQINHWANRANARGLALGYQNAPWLFFHIFRLFITHQNCRAFWLLRSVYRSGKLVTLTFIIFEWLKRIEPNSTTLYDPRIRSKSVHPVDVRRNFSRVRQRPNFAYPLQVPEDATQMDVHRMLYPFYTMSLCWLNLNCQSFVWNIFCTWVGRNAFLSFRKLPNISDGVSRLGLGLETRLETRFLESRSRRISVSVSSSLSRNFA